jgi:hypothetical protein
VKIERPELPEEMSIDRFGLLEEIDRLEVSERAQIVRLVTILSAVEGISSHWEEPQECDHRPPVCLRHGAVLWVWESTRRQRRLLSCIPVGLLKWAVSCTLGNHQEIDERIQLPTVLPDLQNKSPWRNLSHRFFFTCLKLEGTVN